MGNIRGVPKIFRPPYLKKGSSNLKYYSKIWKSSSMRVDIQIYRKIDSSEVCQKCKWTRSQIFQLKIQKFDPLLTPKRGRIAPWYIRDVLWRFALPFQPIKNICDWSFREGENLVQLTPPYISKFSPPYLRNKSNDPQIFSNCCIHRPNVWRDAKNWKLLTSRFRKNGGQKNF